MPGYWIVRASAVENQEAFDEYVRLWPEIAKRYNARALAGRARFEAPEGDKPARVTVIEFPTYEDALACYEDPVYREALPFVNKAGKRDLLIVEGS